MSSMEHVCPVSEVLKAMRLPVEVEWPSFDKMSSHLYRKDLVDRFDQQKLSGEARFMVHFLFSVVNTKARALRGLRAVDQQTQSMSWYNEVCSFVDTQLCRYLTQASYTKKFPAVNIPGTNPGVDLLCFLMSSPSEMHTVEKLSRRTTILPVEVKLRDAGSREGWLPVSMDRGDIRLQEPRRRERGVRLAEAQDDRGFLRKPCLRQVQFGELGLGARSIPEEGYSRDDILAWMRRTEVEIKKIRSDQEKTEKESKGERETKGKEKAKEDSTAGEVTF